MAKVPLNQFNEGLGYFDLMAESFPGLDLTPPAPPVDTSLTGGFSKGFKANAAGTIGNIANAAAVFTGIGGSVGDWGQQVARDNQRRKQYGYADMIPFASDYWSNGQGFMYDIGQQGGSMTVMAPLAIATAAALPEAAIVGTGGIMASILSRAGLSKAAQYIGTESGKELVKWATAGAVGKIPEAIAEGGGVARDILKKTGDLDKAREGLIKTTLTNIPMLMAEGATDFIGLKGVGGALAKGGGKTVQNIAKQAAINMAIQTPQVGTEIAQSLVSNYYSGQNPEERWYNPSTWSDETVESGRAALGGIIPFVGAGTVNSLRQQGRDITNQQAVTPTQQTTIPTSPEQQSLFATEDLPPVQQQPTFASPEDVILGYGNSYTTQMNLTPEQLTAARAQEVQNLQEAINRIENSKTFSNIDRTVANAFTPAMFENVVDQFQPLGPRKAEAAQAMANYFNTKYGTPTAAPAAPTTDPNQLSLFGEETPPTVQQPAQNVASAFGSLATVKDKANYILQFAKDNNIELPENYMRNLASQAPNATVVSQAYNKFIQPVEEAQAQAAAPDKPVASTTTPAQPPAQTAIAQPMVATAQPIAQPIEERPTHPLITKAQETKVALTDNEIRDLSSEKPSQRTADAVSKRIADRENQVEYENSPSRKFVDGMKALSEKLTDADLPNIYRGLKNTVNSIVTKMKDPNVVVDDNFIQATIRENGLAKYGKAVRDKAVEYAKLAVQSVQQQMNTANPVKPKWRKKAATAKAPAQAPLAPAEPMAAQPIANPAVAAQQPAAHVVAQPAAAPPAQPPAPAVVKSPVKKLSDMTDEEFESHVSALSSKEKKDNDAVIRAERVKRFNKNFKLGDIIEWTENGETKRGKITSNNKENTVKITMTDNSKVTTSHYNLGKLRAKNLGAAPKAQAALIEQQKPKEGTKKQAKVATSEPQPRMVTDEQLSKMTDDELRTHSEKVKEMDEGTKKATYAETTKRLLKNIKVGDIVQYETKDKDGNPKTVTGKVVSIDEAKGILKLNQELQDGKKEDIKSIYTHTLFMKKATAVKNNKADDKHIIATGKYSPVEVYDPDFRYEGDSDKQPTMKKLNGIVVEFPGTDEFIVVRHNAYKGNPQTYSLIDGKTKLPIYYKTEDGKYQKAVKLSQEDMQILVTDTKLTTFTNEPTSTTINKLSEKYLPNNPIDNTIESGGDKNGQRKGKENTGDSANGKGRTGTGDTGLRSAGNVPAGGVENASRSNAGTGSDFRTDNGNPVLSIAGTERVAEKNTTKGKVIPGSWNFRVKPNEYDIAVALLEENDFDIVKKYSGKPDKNGNVFIVATKDPANMASEELQVYGKDSLESKGRIEVNDEGIAKRVKKLFPELKFGKAKDGKYVFMEAENKSGEANQKLRINELVKNNDVKAVDLATIKKAFPGADVRQTENNIFVVELPNGKMIVVNTDWNITFNRKMAEEAYRDKYPNGIPDNAMPTGRFTSLGLNGIIDLALGNEQEISLYHEQYHAARAMGLTDKQIKVMERAFANEEQESFAFEAWRMKRDKKPTNTIERIFNDILDFITSIYDNIVNNERAVFRAIESGKIWNKNKPTTKPGGSYKINVWHGSPSNFDKFSTEYLGSGEGRQAFGWGLYFASRKSIAEEYRDKLAQTSYYIDGVKINKSGDFFYIDGHNVWDQVIYGLVSGVTKRLDEQLHTAFVELEEAEEDLRNAETEFEAIEARADIEFLQEAIKFYKELPNRKIEDGENYKKLYEVEISPDEDSFLNWDNPLSKQDKFVKKVLEKIPLDKIMEAAGFKNITWDINSEDFTGEKLTFVIKRAIYQQIHNTNNVKSYGVDLSNIPGKSIDEMTSKYLLSYGIQGIKYADGISRYKRYNKTHNYVVFDDGNVDIVGKYRISQTQETRDAVQSAHTHSEQQTNQWIDSLPDFMKDLVKSVNTNLTVTEEDGIRVKLANQTETIGLFKRNFLSPSMVAKSLKILKPILGEAKVSDKAEKKLRVNFMTKLKNTWDMVKNEADRGLFMELRSLFDSRGMEPIQGVKMSDGKFGIIEMSDYKETFTDEVEALVALDEAKGNYRKTDLQFINDRYHVFGWDGPTFNTQAEADKYAKDNYERAMKDLGANDTVIKAYSSIRDLYNEAHDLMSSVNKLTGLSAPGYRGGYMPHLFDKWIIYRMIPTGERWENGDPKYKFESVESFPSLNDAIRQTKKLMADAPGMKFSVMQKQSGFDSLFNNQTINSRKIADSALKQLQEAQGLSNQDMVDLYQNTANRFPALTKKLAEFFATKKVATSSELMAFLARSNVKQEEMAMSGIENYIKKMKQVTKRQAFGYLENTRGRNRFFGHLQERQGKEGWNKNQEDVDYRYLLSSARYIAKQPFKHNATMWYEKITGQKIEEEPRTELGTYIKDFIYRFNGNPNHVDEIINNAMKNMPFLGNWVKKHLGDKPFNETVTDINQAMAVLKLGMWNISGAIAQFGTLMNINAGLDGHSSALSGKWVGLGPNTFGAFRKAVKPNERHKQLLDELDLDDTAVGLEDEYGQGNRGIFSIKKLNIGKILKHSLTPFIAADRFMRRVAAIGAYDKAIKEGKAHEEAVRIAEEFSMKTNFNYAQYDSPPVLEHAGALGSMIFQFKKYPIKQLEYVFGHLDGAEKKTFWTSYFIMAGMFAVPGADWLKEMIKNITGYDVQKELKEPLMKWAGNDKQRQAIAKQIMYGFASNVGGFDFHQRIGLGDFLPSSAANLTGPAIGTALNVGSLIRDNSFDSNLIPHIVKAISPSLGNMIQGVKGEAVAPHNRERLVTKYDPYEQFLRIGGFIPIREAIERDKTYISSMNKTQKAEDYKKAIDSYIKNPNAENAAKLKYYNIDAKKINEEIKKKGTEGIKRAVDEMAKNPKSQADKELKARMVEISQFN